MRCEQCNHPLSENSTYYPFCGTKVEPVSDDSLQQPWMAGHTEQDETYSLAFLADALEKQKSTKPNKAPAGKPKLQETPEEAYTIYQQVVAQIPESRPKPQHAGKKKGSPILAIVLGSLLLISLVCHAIQWASYLRLSQHANSLKMENSWQTTPSEDFEESPWEQYSKGYETGYQKGYEAGYAEAKEATPSKAPVTTPGKGKTQTVTAPSVVPTAPPSTPSPTATTSYQEEEEEKKLCAYAGCSSTVGNTSYCTRHECSKGSCHNPIVNDYFSYCVNHKCSISTCGSSRAWNSIFCDQHGD